MTYDDLIALLEPIGLPIVEPGVVTKALPCISVEPTGMSTADGFAYLYNDCDIKVMVPLGQNNPAQFDLLHAYTIDVWRVLFGTHVQVDDDGPLFGEDTDPQALFFQLSVRFPGETLCPVKEGIPPTITTLTLNPINVGSYFEQQIEATGTPNIVFAFTAGDIPDGLSMSIWGLITGTPTTAGPYDFDITASSLAGEDTRNYTGTITELDYLTTVAGDQLTTVAGDPLTTV